VNPLLADAPRAIEVDRVTPEMFAAEIAPSYRPVVMRGLVADWPAVAAGRAGAAAMAAYLRRFDRGHPADVMVAAPGIGGRFFYDDDLRGFNFKRAKVNLPLLLDQLVAQQDDAAAPALYAGAAAVAEQVPGWTEENALPLDAPDAVPRIWLGNASRVSMHYDVSDNIAAVVAGRRRFALFPPEQARNLYVGPLDVTIAGQPTSMVDLEDPDLDRHPRFAEALQAMTIAELEPGDALFVPSLWWHEVKATGPLNVLVNYWWGQPAAASPFPALVHAIMAVRDLPPGQRAAMRDWFDLYVFGDEAQGVADHLPVDARGVLDRPSPARDDAIRQYLIRALGRG
jgi:hypothetical protein